MSVILAVTAASIFGVSSAETISEKSSIDNNSSLYRLPKNVLPENYELFLQTNVTQGNFKYTGEVSIFLRVVKKTRRITLHADKLTIIDERTILTSDDDCGISIKHQYDDKEKQFYVVELYDELEPGKYKLKLYFRGEVLDDVFGFYRSSYKRGNATRWIGITQFSPTYARRAFPCLDEPGFKAKFQLSVGHYGNETVTSNTLPESVNVTDHPNYYLTTFSLTPPMSTYLFGWAIHDFHRVNFTSSPNSSTQIPLWTRHDDHELPQPLASLLEGPKIYSILENYTNASNPLAGKLEQFAVPDFNFNGMENWGMIAYRESVPLSGESHTPLGYVHDGLVTLAHEYAHSWFGNLVTPSFWDVAWLKEGFATFFAYLAMDFAHKDWHVMDLFALEVLQTSLLDDSEDHNRTMNGRGIGSPESAKAALDFVTYEKGASIIRMIADDLGDIPFRDAIRSYLQEYRYKAVVPSNLYKHLDRASNSSLRLPSSPSISDYVESWANQPNYPLIRAKRLNSQQIHITQQVFKLYRNDTNSSIQRLWLIQIEIATPSNHHESDKLIETTTWHGPDRSDVIDIPINASWYILNPRQIGYYRVDYATNEWQAFIKLLRSDDYQDLPRISRAALLDDIFNLARAGYRDYELALDFAKYLEHETDYEPWIAACRAIRLLDNRLRENPSVQLAFRRYAIGLMKPIYEQLSFKELPSDSRIRKMNRNLILSTMCSLNHDSCVSKAKALFDDWINGRNESVPANLKDFVYLIGIKNGTNEDWIKLWQRFLQTDLYAEKEIIMKALSKTKNYDFINRFIEFSIQPDSDIKRQYRLSIIQWVISGNNKNIDNVLRYIDENLQKIINLRGHKFLGNILTTIGEQVTSNEQERKLTLFINKNHSILGNAIDAGKNAIELARKNLVWINDCVLQIARYFKL